MLLGGDAAEVDWIVGYGPPPENFEAKLEKILRGEDTFKALSAAYAKNPKDVALVFKLARKWSDRYDEAKSVEKYKEVIALDPQGKSGSYTNEYTKVTAPDTEYAAFEIAVAGLGGQKPDMKPVRDFMARYPRSPLLKEAYSEMSYYYGYQAPKEEARKFFEEYAAKYPDDPNVLDSWLTRIIRDKEPLDKGIELAEKIQTLMRGYPSDPYKNQNIANIYLLKNDTAEAEQYFGKDYIEGRVSSLAYTLVNYANFWMQRNANQDSAVKMAETAHTLLPDNSYILGQVAGVYVKAKMEDKALAVYGPAYMKKNLADASALYSYGSFWAGQGKNLDSALAAAKKSVELKPNQYYMWSSLSNVYAKMKNYAEAIKAIEKAIELAPDSLKETYKKTLEKIKSEAGKK
jgi:tetratricopeptide (TPR) repeat protein